jgi:hypothetical protein
MIDMVRTLAISRARAAVDTVMVANMCTAIAPRFPHAYGANHGYAQQQRCHHLCCTVQCAADPQFGQSTGPHTTQTSILAAAVRRGYVYLCIALMIQVMSVCLWLLT